MYTMYYFENNKLCIKKINEIAESYGYNVYCIKDCCGMMVVSYREYFV